MATPIEISWKNTRSRFEAGSYSGDGSTTGNVINLGFVPDIVFVQEDASARTAIGMGSNSVGITPGLADAVSDQTSIYPNSGATDGIQVGDGDAEFNASGTTYNYFAWQLGDSTSEVAWKDERAKYRHGSYTGDGATTGRTISTGFTELRWFIQEKSGPRTWFHLDAAADSSLALQPGLTNIVADETAVDNSGADVFTVGDGSDAANVDTTNYEWSVFRINTSDSAIEASWKNDRLKMAEDGYLGDGSSDGSNEISVGFQPDLAIITRDDGQGDQRAWVTMDTTNAGKVDSGTNAGNGGSSEVSGVHLSTNGVTVGDGSTEANANNETFQLWAVKVA